VTGADERRTAVGVVGSPATHVAVRWATGHARQLGRDLVAPDREATNVVAARQELAAVQGRPSPPEIAGR
jgi:hypothetical protein